MTEPHILRTTDADTHRLDRRTFFGLGAAAILGAGGIAAVGGNIFAQEEAETPGGSAACATPGASPEASPAASPGASPEASPAASAACPAEGESEYVVNAVDIAYDPTELTIPAGTDVTVTIVNQGALRHDFVIDELEVNSGLLDGGASTTVTINAPAGTYEYYCTEPGHKQAGMVGTLTVE